MPDSPNGTWTTVFPRTPFSGSALFQNFPELARDPTQKRPKPSIKSKALKEGKEEAGMALGVPMGYPDIPVPMPNGSGHSLEAPRLPLGGFICLSSALGE